MSGVWGNKIQISIFGESHGNAIGINISGLPSGVLLDMEAINEKMERRAPGRSKISTARSEADKVEILSGVFEGRTTGAPLCGIIRNSDTRSQDYSKLKDLMRPGHSDYPAKIRYQGFNDYRGGGHFSGRITAPLVFAGAIAEQILKEKGVYIGAHVKSINNIEDDSFNPLKITKEQLASLKGSDLSVLNNEQGEKMRELILQAKKEGDSLGGVVECAIAGIPAGVGDPFFDSIESTLAHLVFSVPAVKGIEFGAGFDITKMKGSKANDSYYYDGEEIKTKTNNNGGILGGISNGMPIIFRAAVKPTSSIIKIQDTIDVNKKQEDKLQVVGRHDTCIVSRAVVVIEAVSALGILDLMLR
ncbi:chorismate synthase [Clostridium sp. YIM B02551]|uniref:chorismate synthase n=1 Tax=Clostridium sp. YIM B02551 TaxID=2910679 RepID=UPI001EEAE6B6|nr:chorismate synthase [Clostridium sp. YIM B02551]